MPENPGERSPPRPSGGGRKDSALMHTLVCIKQVPDTTEVRIDPETNTLVREGVPSIVNPYDMHALEMALRLRDRHGGRVTVITMGPPQAKEALKRAISLGADEAILLSDRAFAGSDTLATSYILSQAIRKVGEAEPVDLVLCGKQAIDGDTAQVGPGIASRLGIPQITYVSAVESLDPEAREIRVRRILEEGQEVIKSSLPALLTVLIEANTIRYATMRDMIKAERYDPPAWTKDSIDINLGEAGLKGSPTAVRRIFAPPQREGETEMIADGLTEPEKAGETLAGKLLALGFGAGGNHRE